VLTRSTQVPLAGALVHASADIGHTNESGLCHFSVRPGDVVNVDVSAEGFEGFGASGVVANDEQWTFYLGRVASGE
jgi:hypothetical protein